MSKQASVSSNIKRWRVEKLKRCKTNGVNRVSAQINDEMVWFESADAPLTPNPEAFATAFLLPALEQGAELVMEDPVSGVWLDNIEQLLPIWNKWWRYPLKNPIVCQRSDGAAKTPPAATLTGACFTGGVDSFYTLLRSRHSIDALVFVHGYDIPLEDSKRMAAFEPGMRGVAETLNKKSIIVRSNLRRHHCFSGTNWERSHGAALAATAHALRSNFGRLIIPTTLTYDRTHGWGSHWMTDSLWSSESLEIVHDDATWRRSEKIMMMAHKPILWNNLRVCWENRRPEGNCSSCEKCLRTMIALTAAGQLENYTVFDQKLKLARQLAELPTVPPHLLNAFANLNTEQIPRDLQKALTLLIRRTKKCYYPNLFRRSARLMKQQLVGLLKQSVKKRGTLKNQPIP